jgi:hypothetical protein
MMSYRFSPTLSLFFVAILIAFIAACTTETSNSNARTSRTDPVADGSPADSSPAKAVGNNSNEKLQKSMEEFFAEGPPIDVPECLALETATIARQREEGKPDEVIRKNIYASRNIIRMEKDPAKQAQMCKNWLEMQQKIPLDRNKTH